MLLLEIILKSLTNIQVFIALIALFGAILAAVFAFAGSLIGYYVQVQISKTSRSDKYFFSALDKKLKAHQEAFDLALGLSSVAHKSDKQEGINYVNKCQKWWRENCLYLEPAARRAFYEVLITTSFYHNSLECFKDKSITKEELDEKWNEIIALPNVIEKGINKPLIKPTKLAPQSTAEGKKLS